MVGLNLFGFEGLGLGYRWIEPPAGKNYWGSTDQSRPYIRYDGAEYIKTIDRFGNDGPFVIKIDGLKVQLNIVNLKIEKAKDGSHWRPAAVQPAGSGVIIRMGDTGASAHYLFGPVDLQKLYLQRPDGLDYETEFDGYRQLLKLHARADFLTDLQMGEAAEALLLSLREGRWATLDLRDAKVRIPKGHLTATLRRGRPNPGEPLPTMYESDGEIAFDFAELAKKTRPPRTFSLVKTAGSADAPLNLAAGVGGQAGLEALAGGLSVTLEPPPNKSAGALLSAAALTGAPQSKVRFRGLRNARNAYEVWQTPNRTELGFRVYQPGVADGAALILPGQQMVGGWTRVDGGFSGNGGSGGQLPFYTRIPDAQYQPDANADASLSVSKAAATKRALDSGWCAKDLQWMQTRPWLGFTGVSFVHTRAGEAYHRDATGQVGWVFRGGAGVRAVAAPGTPLACWAGSGAAAADAEVDAIFHRAVLAPQAATHETGLKDETAVAATIVSVLSTPTVVLSEHDRAYRIGAPDLARAAVCAPTLPIPMIVSDSSRSDGQPVDYAVKWSRWTDAAPQPKIGDTASWKDLLTGSIDPQVPIDIGLIPDPDGDFPLAIFKLNRTRTLRSILDEIQVFTGAGQAFEQERDWILGLIARSDPAILQKPWVGLILFNLGLSLDNFPTLKALAPVNELAERGLAYLAARPNVDTTRPPALSAAVHWPRPDYVPPKPPAGKDDQEATLTPKQLTAAFRDRRLLSFYSRNTLAFRSFMGQADGFTGVYRTVDIIGSVRQLPSDKPEPEYEIRFAAEVSDQAKLVIYPYGDAQSSDARSFLKQVSVRRVEVVDRPPGKGETGRQAEIQIDGDIDFKAPEVAKFNSDFLKSLRGVGFRNLRIDLSAKAGDLLKWLTLSYPSLRFDLNLPHVSLLGDALKLKFHQAMMDWDGSGFRLGQFPQFPGLGFGDIALDMPKLVLLGRIDFGSLPELFGRTLSGFSLEGVFALGRRNGGDLQQYFGIRGFGFDGFNLDLMSFLRLRARRIALERYPTGQPNAPTGAAVVLEDGSLEIMGVRVLKRVDGGYFSLDKDLGDGFWAILSDPVDFTILKIDWVFAARNIRFSTDTAKLLLTPPPDRSKDQPGVTPQIGDQLNAAWKSGDLGPATTDASRGWAFAASLNIFDGLFRGRVLFQDHGFKGLAIWGDALTEALGYEFQLVGLYYKDITPGQDYFYISVTLPAFTSAGVRFMAGQFAAELYTGGSFLVDYGFPWPHPKGGRRWDRAIGTIVTPGQAAGGIYFGKRDELVQAGKAITLRAGFALEWGLGAAFSIPTFEVWVRIGVYLIVEGRATLTFGSSVAVTSLHLFGAAGILVEGHGHLDWWVISVDVGLRASVEVGVGLDWDEPGPVLMNLRAEVAFSASAEACIGPSFARVCKGIDVHMTFPVHHTLRLG